MEKKERIKERKGANANLGNAGLGFGVGEEGVDSVAKREVEERGEATDSLRQVNAVLEGQVFPILELSKREEKRE